MPPELAQGGRAKPQGLAQSAGREHRIRVDGDGLAVNRCGQRDNPGVVERNANASTLESARKVNEHRFDVALNRALAKNVTLRFGQHVDECERSMAQARRVNLVRRKARHDLE